MLARRHLAFALAVERFYRITVETYPRPVWQAIIQEFVERRELPSAVAPNATGFNVARAVGLALCGLVVAAAGSVAGDSPERAHLY